MTKAINFFINGIKVKGKVMVKMLVFNWCLDALRCQTRFINKFARSFHAVKSSATVMCGIHVTG
jgi:hypothetical protein